MREMYTINQMEVYARNKGGDCLSKQYKSLNSKLKWQCSKGHVWTAIPASVFKRGSWCPHCLGRIKSIKDIKNFAKLRKGKFLSKNYKNAHIKYEWKCADSHKFFMTFNMVQQGQWCPQCSSGFSEELCRTTFEQIFQNKFPKTKPEWLVNSRGNLMELDGYSEKLKIGFEYQGKQHFKLTYYSKNQKILKERILDDKLKARICKRKNVKLFIIKYTDNIIKLIDLIKDQSKKLKINLNQYDLKKDINFNKVYEHRSRISSIKKKAISKGGSCLSTKYAGHQTKLKFKCNIGHIWFATYNDIMHGSKGKGTWCPNCGGTKKQDIQQIKKRAKEIGIKCLSNRYPKGKRGKRIKLLWECRKGHIWRSTMNDVLNGRYGCPDCGGTKKLNISIMRNIAKENGGKCLSRNYVNARTKLKWICSKKHIWYAVGDSVKNFKTWCPKCRRTRKNLN